MPGGLPRVVLDTNLFIRGLLKGKVTTPLIDAWLDAQFNLVTSPELLGELTQVVARPRLRVLIPAEDSDKLLELIYRQAIIVYPDVQPPFCRDPDDYPVLAAAIAGQADYLVTGDDDLRDDPRLKAEMAELGVEIISVPEFLRVLDYLALGAGPEEGVEPPWNLR